MARAVGKLIDNSIHSSAVNSEAARIFGEAFTFIGSHCEKRSHQSKFYWVASRFIPAQALTIGFG